MSFFTIPESWEYGSYDRKPIWPIFQPHASGPLSSSTPLRTVHPLQPAPRGHRGSEQPEQAADQTHVQERWVIRNMNADWREEMDQERNWDQCLSLQSPHVNTHTSFCWACFFSRPNIYPPVDCRHSCCVCVPPSGISHLPLASSALRPCLLPVSSSSASSDSIHQAAHSIIPSLVSLLPDLSLLPLSPCISASLWSHHCVSGRPAELTGLTEHIKSEIKTEQVSRSYFDYLILEL